MWMWTYVTEQDRACARTWRCNAMRDLYAASIAAQPVCGGTATLVLLLLLVMPPAGAQLRVRPRSLLVNCIIHAPFQ